MTAAGQTPFHPLRRFASKFVVFMGDNDGTFPEPADIVTSLLPSQVRLGCGADGVDAMDFVGDLFAAGWRMQDVQTPVGHNRIVELRRIKASGEVGELLCWGKLEAQEQRLGGNEETLQFTASPKSLLRGDGFAELPYFDGIKDAIIAASEGWVFNPTIDDRDEGNRSSHQDGDKAYCFAHPEAFRSPKAQAAQAVHAATRHLWTIAQAVFRVCWSLNPDETYLTNPTMADLDDVIDAESEVLFRNVQIPLDATLLEALDLLLKPCGYTWHLRYSGDVGDVTTTLKIIRLGHGIETDFLLQRLNSELDSNQTNAAELSLRWDIVAKPNVIIGYAAPLLVENTWTLIPDWDISFNNYSWEQVNTVDVPREVGRKWVLNEAGDANRFQGDASGNILHLSTFPYIARRRKFLPCLTLEPDGQPTGANGYALRWDGDDAEFGFSVLHHECGIMLEGKIPQTLWAQVQGGGANLEMTATVEIEVRHVFRADRRDKSPNGAEVVMPVDLSHKFGRKLVQGGDSGSSRFFWARHAFLLEVVAGKAAAATFRFDRDVEDDVKPGYRISVLSRNANKLRDDSVSTSYEGTYHAESVNGDTVTLREAIETGTAQGADPIAWCGFNTDESDCLQRLEKHVVEMQAQEDFALLAADVTMAGADHLGYSRGQLIRSAKPRGLSFNAYADDKAPRYPQIVGITVSLNPEQTTTIQLEQLQQVRHD